VTIAPITSAIRDIPSEVVLGPSDGMPRSCAINLDHVQTVRTDRLGAVLTTLPSSRMREIREALSFALGFLRSLGISATVTVKIRVVAPTVVARVTTAMPERVPG
jgi:hypothetical protein